MKHNFIVVHINSQNIGVSVSLKTLRKYSCKYHVPITELPDERFIHLSCDLLSRPLLRRALLLAYSYTNSLD